MFKSENKREKKLSEEEPSGLTFFESNDEGIKDPEDDELPTIEHEIACADPSAPFVPLLDLGNSNEGKILRKRK